MSITSYKTVRSNIWDSLIKVHFTNQKQLSTLALILYKILFKLWPRKYFHMLLIYVLLIGQIAQYFDFFKKIFSWLKSVKFSDFKNRSNFLKLPALPSLKILCNLISLFHRNYDVVRKKTLFTYALDFDYWVNENKWWRGLPKLNSKLF